MAAESNDRVTDRCGTCGSAEDLVLGYRYVQQGGEAAEEPLATCRRCLGDALRRDSAERAAYWARVADGGPGDAQQAASVRAVAAAIRERHAAFGIEPDERTAAFIARYAT
jgi:hypothetical protein